MLRKLALCAGLVLALTLTGCANTTASTTEESSVGFDANAKAACKTECAEAKADCAATKADCAKMKAECEAKAAAEKDAATKN